MGGRGVKYEMGPTKGIEVGSKVTYYNMLTKRNKTSEVITVLGDGKYEMNDSHIVYSGDVVKVIKNGGGE